MKNLSKRLVAGVAAAALGVTASAPAFAFEPERDQRVMAYWSFDFGGPQKKVEERNKFGLSVNLAANHNQAYSSHGTAFGFDSHDRPDLLNFSLGLNGEMKGLALNGSDLVQLDQALYADGDEEGGTLFGVKWYYVLFAAMGAGTAGYLIYDAFSDDDEDE